MANIFNFFLQNNSLVAIKKQPMTGIAKTPEHPLTTIKNFERAEKNRELALTAASSLPNQSIGELLQNAEKIERWLNEPILKQKSPETNSEAFDGVSGD